MRKNKKGFTLVELVIVIAVIAILAAVLLPTFAGIIRRARYNSALQRATGARDEYFSANLDTIDEMVGATIYVENDDDVYVFTVGEGGVLTSEAEAPVDNAEVPEEAEEISDGNYIVMPTETTETDETDQTEGA